MEDQKELNGLRGWLILVGIGVVLSPIRLLLMSLPIYIPIFKDGTWSILTTVGSHAYHPLWAPLLIGEMVINSGIFIASAYLIYLFFSKHYLFPKLYIGIVIVSIILIPLDGWVVSYILPDEIMFDPETTKSFATTLISGLIWIPYMLVSKRVKATFI